MAPDQENRKHRLMVVDKKPEVVNFLYEFFERKGYDVFKAGNGDTALKIIEEENPGILLLDIELEGKVSGENILNFAKSRYPGTKIIIMTSDPDGKNINKMFDQGAEECIVKPFSLNYLEQVVILKVLNIEKQI